MARKKNHHLFERGDTWYFRKRVHGQSIKKALSNNLTEARRLRDQHLREIALYGRIQDNVFAEEQNVLFGELAQEWIGMKRKEIRASTLRDYRSSMNYHILPRIGNMPIRDLGYLEVQRLISSLDCTGKRLKNVMVPIREVFKFAQLAGFIEKNPMALIQSPKTSKPDIDPLSMEEVALFLEAVSARYRDFFTVAFFTGMRFGEMAALKWKNVDFRLGIIKVRETRVRGEETPPKTKRSIRDITMLPPVVEALRDQRRYTMGKSEYAFLNQYGRPLLPDSVNSHVWKPALRKAGLRERPLKETRHTFATLMLDGGELPGWVQRMMGHETLQMIHDRYYSYIKNYQRNDGSAFMENVYRASLESLKVAKDSVLREAKCGPNVAQNENGESAAKTNSP